MSNDFTTRYPPANTKMSILIQSFPKQFAPKKYEQAWWRQWFNMWKERLFHCKFITWHKKISCTAYTGILSCQSPRSAPCVESGESPPSVRSVIVSFIDSRESIFRLPCTTSRLTHYARVEYTSLDMPDWSRFAFSWLHLLYPSCKSPF
jgi:hypothetical protein